MVVSCQRDDVHPPCSLVDAVLEFHVFFAGPDTEETLGGLFHTCRARIGTQILDHTFHSGALLRASFSAVASSWFFMVTAVGRRFRS